MVVLTEITQQSSSSLSTYDVFLSFRGADTRHNFTDHLLKALQEASIRTFFDDSEIQIGYFLKPELESAIKSSRASIIVLSKNYATSTWCLDELAFIMEQGRTSKHIVIPIFYHVKPSDVRKQRNSFGDAMAEHKQRMEAESDEEKRSELGKKIEKWKKALMEVADMKGKEANGRRETKLIEEIIKEISSRLDLYKRSKIPHIIGRGSWIGMITSFLQDKSRHSTEILTIWGMAGIGKTCLANYVFQLHYLDFERSCFLEDIERRCTPPNGSLLDLQKQLLKDMRAGIDVNNVNEGTFNIENLLFTNRSLLVLDGINKLEQLDVLIGTKGLHPGSKVIITSINGSLTEKCRLFETQVPPKHAKRQLHGLNDEESLRLLSWHASVCNKGEKSWESMKVVEYCQGHPLALEVLGSSLRSEDATWEAILESLGKQISPDVTKVLKISFDTLPSEKEKEMFKHIACLFVGEDITLTEDTLKACGICKSSGIKILINRGLLNVGYKNRILMHQLLQDMGRDIVRQESPKELWKRSILWHHEECLDVLQNRHRTPTIQALVLDMKHRKNQVVPICKSSHLDQFKWIHILLLLFDRVVGMCSSSRKTKGDFTFETVAFSEMYELRLLKLNYVQLSGSYKNFPQGLRWLCMHGFPLSYIPADLEIGNMVVLDMSNSKLQQLWKKPKLLRSLKLLNLSNCCELVRVGHFSGLPLLEKLTLVGCTSLVEVCESIGACQNLEVLDLSRCTKLNKLPKILRELNNLSQLIIDGCSNLAEFSVERKSHGSSSSTMIPRCSKSFVNFLPRSLVTLSLKDNNLYNESFPMDFSSLPFLKELYLDGNPIHYMPDCVRSLRRLKTLTFCDCGVLKTVLGAPNTLKDLDVSECKSLKKITFHPEKSAPPYVNDYSTPNAIEIQDKFKIQALSEIDAEVVRSLGWSNKEYMHQYWLSKLGNYTAPAWEAVKLPFSPHAQVLYEHGIFSTYLEGQEVPKWFTHRSSGSLFTLQSSPENGKIKGINVCVVLSQDRFGPSRIEIRNVTKNSSWTYEPLFHFIRDCNVDRRGVNEEVIVWLSHWMFGNNEFEDGDAVSIHFSVKSDEDIIYQLEKIAFYYGGEGPDYANVKEYGIKLVYDDGDSQKEDPLGYYKSWKHIIGRDISASEVSPSHYVLTPCYAIF